MRDRRWSLSSGRRVCQAIVAFLMAATFAGATFSSPAGATLTPVANDDNYSVVHNGTLTEAAPGVLANDQNLQGIQFTLVLQDSTDFGSLSLNLDGSFEYTPFTGFVGSDTFTYSLDMLGPADVTGAGQSFDTALVTITVTNNPPVPGNDDYATNQDTELTVPAPGVLANDSDPDGDPIGIAGLSDDVDNGTLSFDQSTGAFVYTPNPGFVGVDTFVYTIVDILAVKKEAASRGGFTTQGVNGVPATVTITVTGLPTPTVEPTVEPTTVPGEPTATPEPPAPTATSDTTGGVTDLPDTGTGESDHGPGGMAYLVVLSLTLAVTGVTIRRRSAKHQG